MLNRRILRSKAVQYMYGLLQSHTANYHLAIDHIKDHFAPDLMSLEPQDKVKLAADAEVAVSAFTDLIQNDKPVDPEMDIPLKKAVNAAQLFMLNAIKKDNSYMATTLVQQTEAVHDSYVLTLQILIRIINFLEEDFVKKHHLEEKVFTFRVKLLESLEIRSNKTSKETAENISDLAYNLYKEVLVKDQHVIEVFKNKLGDFEAERALLRDLIKVELLKHPYYETLMEEEDFDWSENRLAVKDLVNKTLKNLTPDTPPAQILIGISANWDEDKLFLKELFLNALDNKDKYIKFITSKLQNWDVSRISEIDMAILIIALSEMTSFPSIPVKVSINEYLEIAKEYSTPKSKDFINGLLDKVSLDLIDKGIIKKSGRGLIDNK
ncbi:MAG TPA: transcription antitermination factor NusB [Cytophagales bacterium]|nr:transcription antitermination factor NusB [Cytophagales bacterium]